MQGFTRNILEEVSQLASQGKVASVVRIMREPPLETETVTVRDDKLCPPISSAMLSEHIIAGARELTASGKPTALIEVTDEEGSVVRLVIETVVPKLDLVVFGAGHVGQATALIAAIVGYHVTVVDDREEFASRARLPDPRIHLLVANYAEATLKLKISASTAVVIVTRGHQHDELCLKNVINSGASYIGMIGSRKRVASVFKKLVGEGFSQDALKRVRAPIGLRIGATSPQEIAVSILAEIIDHLKNPHREHKGERHGI